MSRLGAALAACLILLVTACKDYGEFTVAERRRVDDETFPALSEIDLRDINMEFAIGSELHARLVPDAQWPEPIGTFLFLARAENDGVLPEEFDFPIPDACIYVGADPKSSRFRRFELAGHRFLIMFHFRKAPYPRPEDYRPEPRTVVIDEAIMKAFPVPNVSGRMLDVFVLDDAVAILFIDRGRLILHRMRISDAGLQFSEPEILHEIDGAPHAIDSVAVEIDSDGIVYFAWIMREGPLTHHNYLNSVQFDLDDPKQNAARRLSSSVAQGTLSMHKSNGQVIASWIDSRFATYGFATDNPGKAFLLALNEIQQKTITPFVLNRPLDDTDNADFPLIASPTKTDVFFAWGTYETGSWRGRPVKLGIFDFDDASVMVRRSSTGLDNIRAEAISQQADLQRSFPIPGASSLGDEYCDTWRERLPDNGVRVLDPVTHQPVRPWP